MFFFFFKKNKETKQEKVFSNHDLTANHDKLSDNLYLVSKFKSIYIPEKRISFAKELLLWKGTLVLKQ